MNLHPKTSGAAVGVALGTIIVGILHSIHGITLAPELAAAIPSFLGILLSWLVPDLSSQPPPGPSGGSSSDTPSPPPVATGGPPQSPPMS